MTDNYAARNERRAREVLAICASIGAVDQNLATLTITADPMIPDDNHPENREYFVEIDVLEHEPTGFVTGVGKRKYRILLEEVDND